MDPMTPFFPLRHRMWSEEPRHLGHSMTFQLSERNRPALEVAFDTCLKCLERLRNCTCHERGCN